MRHLPSLAALCLCLGCAPDLREDRPADSLPQDTDTGGLITDGETRTLTCTIGALSRSVTITTPARR